MKIVQDNHFPVVKGTTGLQKKNYGIPKILLGYPDFFVSMNMKRANCL